MDATTEIRMNIRMALFCLAVIMAATVVGTGWNTWQIQAASYDRSDLVERIDDLESTEAENHKKVNGRIDYLRRQVNKRFSELESREKK